MDSQFKHPDDIGILPDNVKQPLPPFGVVTMSQHPICDPAIRGIGCNQPSENNHVIIGVCPGGEPAFAPLAQKEITMGEAAVTTSPVSYSIAEEASTDAHIDGAHAAATVTNEPALNPVVESVTSIRSKILAARKAPEEVAQLIATQTEQLTVPVYKRPPDGAFWRVRSGGEWDPQLSEVLLLPRKDGGGGPEFLLVLPEVEPVFNNDPRLRNMVRYHYLAFTVDSRGRVGWWAVPSRSENDWHKSARTAMRRLTDEWGMIKSDQGAKSYVLEKPVDNLGNPMWPAGSYDDWFFKGLSDKVVDAPDHPILRELQGRK
jgi:hypothetical protein